MPLTTLVRVARSRWRIEETFKTGKGLAGLDEHQVRRYSSWTRRVTLAMLAHAFLAGRAPRRRTTHRPAPDTLIPLTCNEIARLFIALVAGRIRDTAHRLVGGASFVDPGVAEGGDALGDGVLVFAQGSGEAGERGQSAVREVVEPARKGCGVAVVEHAGEPADQVVGVPELGAVIEEPGQAVVDV